MESSHVSEHSSRIFPLPSHLAILRIYSCHFPNHLIAFFFVSPFLLDAKVDIPYFMIALPSCRYSIFHVLTKIGVKDRMVRLNELSMVTHVEKAMEYYFGPPDVAGWDRSHCKKMQEALHNHLLTGLSRDYNSPLDLGHLYSWVSKEKLSFALIEIMAKQCSVSDYHPVVLDFVYRWNRLCRFYESNGGEVEAHPAAYSKSFLFWGVPAETQPTRETLPFEYFTADVMRNPVLEPVPRLFKLQVVNLLTADEQRIQGKSIPIINFYETVLRLKLFIQEADSLRVLGLVDDFCIRKNHDFFFGQDSKCFSISCTLMLRLTHMLTPHAPCHPFFLLL